MNFQESKQTRERNHTSLMDQYYTVITVTAIFTSAIMVLSTRANATLPRDKKVLFCCIFGTVAVAASCEYLGVYFVNQGPAMAKFVTIVKPIEYSLAPALAVFYAGIFVKSDDRHFRIAGIVVMVHALFECVAAPFGIVSYVSEDGVYHHGVAYIVYIAAYVGSALFLLLEMKRCTVSFQYRNRYMPWLIVLFILAASAIQMVDSETKFVWMVMAIAATMFYLFFCGIVQQTDALTLLLNRYSYESTLATLDKQAIILFVDVDNFKFVNDHFSHNTGDECLQIIGRTLYETYGHSGSCFRYGGDEFCVVLTKNLDALHNLNAQMEATLDKLRETHEFLPTVSIGYEEFDPNMNDLVQVTRQADEMMYERKRAKKVGRG